MWTNIYVAILASIAVQITATYVGYPELQYAQPLSSYSDLYSPFTYSPYDFGSSHNYFPGPSTGHIQGFPNFFYPGAENTAVEVARKKASNAVDKIATVTDKKKVVTKTKTVETKEPCDIIQPGFQNIYSFDNGPLIIRDGFDFHTPSFAPFGFGYEPFGHIFPDTVKDIKDTKGKGKDDDDTVAIERKVTVSVPGAKPQNDGDRTINVSVPDTTESNDVSSSTESSSDNVTNEDEDETKTISPLPLSTDEPSSSSASTEADDASTESSSESSKRKRQSRKGKKL